MIDTVRRYPCLWNTTAIEYRDQELKDAAWAEVMKETDLSSGELPRDAARVCAPVSEPRARRRAGPRAPRRTHTALRTPLYLLPARTGRVEN